MKKKFLIFLISALVLLCIYKVFLYIHNKNQRSVLNTLITNSVAFYTNDIISNLRIDSYMMLKVATKYTKNGKILPSESKYDNDPFVRFLNKEKQFSGIDSLLERIYPFVKNFEDTESLAEPRRGILLKALYCDVVGYSDLDFSILQLTNTKNGSYDDTHFLLGLLFLKNNGCYEPDIIEKSIKEVVAEIISAENNDTTFSDLYAERIATLYWAGYGQYVEKKWINFVEDNYNKKDFGWRANKNDISSHPHTTGLALLSLIYYLDGKTEQPIY